jgi:cell division protein FtsB
MSSVGLAQKAPLKKRKKTIKKTQVGIKNAAFAAVRLVVFACMLGALASLTISIYFRVVITKDSFYNNELEKKIESEKIVKEKLEATLASLKSPQRIEKVAVEDLGMVKPTEVSYIILPPLEERLPDIVHKKKKLEIGFLDRLADSLAQSRELAVEIRKNTLR